MCPVAATFSTSGYGGGDIRHQRIHGKSGEVQRLLVYHNGEFATSPTDRPIVGWIIAGIPQDFSGGKVMTLVFCKEGLNMVIFDQAMGEQMIEV